MPFLTKIIADPEPDLKQLSAAIIAAKIEFSRAGLIEPADIVETAENKLHELTFNPLRDVLAFSKDSKVYWSCLNMKLES